jgi:hypothetical protein
LGEHLNLVGEVFDGDLEVLEHSIEVGVLSSQSVALVGEIVDLSLEVSVSISENLTLVGQVGNGGLGVLESSLKLLALSCSSVQLVGQFSNVTLKIHNKVVKIHVLGFKSTDLVVGVVKGIFQLKNSVVSSIQVGLGVTEVHVQSVSLLLKHLVAVSKVNIHVLKIGVVVGKNSDIILEVVVSREHLAVDHVDVRDWRGHSHHWGGHSHHWGDLWDVGLWDVGGGHWRCHNWGWDSGHLWNDINSVNHWWSDDVGGVRDARDREARSVHRSS